MWVNLKPPDERKLPIRQVAHRLRERLAKVNNLRVTITPASDLYIGINTGGGRYQYTLSGDDTDALIRRGGVMLRRIAAISGLADVVANWENQGLQAGLSFDRVQAASMGITPMAIDNTLYDAFGQRQIRTIYLPFNFSQVILEVDPMFQTDPSSFDQIFVGGAAGLLKRQSETLRVRARHHDYSGR